MVRWKISPLFPPPCLGNQIVQHLETPLAVVFAVARSGAHDSNLILLLVEPLAAYLLDVVRVPSCVTPREAAYLKPIFFFKKKLNPST